MNANQVAALSQIAMTAYQSLPAQVQQKLNFNQNQDDIKAFAMLGDLTADRRIMEKGVSVNHELRIGLKRYAPEYQGGSAFVRVHYGKRPAMQPYAELSITDYPITDDVAALIELATSFELTTFDLLPA